MLQLEFTETEKQALHYERFNHPHPRVQLKMEVLWLKSQNLPHWQICQLTGISENTLRSYCQAYREGGTRLRWDGLDQTKRHEASFCLTLRW
jgi:hypothetical protein